MTSKKLKKQTTITRTTTDAFMMVSTNSISSVQIPTVCDPSTVSNSWVKQDSAEWGRGK